MASGASQPTGAQAGPGVPLTHPAPVAAHEQPAALVSLPAGRAWWFWPLAGLIGLLLLGTIAWGLQILADLRVRQAGAAPAQPQQWSADAPARVPVPRRSVPISDDDLLRKLLGE